MGVTTDGDTAVFLIDTSLKASGEGTCKPSPDVCSFLYMKVDKQTTPRICWRRTPTAPAPSTR